VGKSPHDAGARELTADDPTVELDILEQTMSIEGARVLRHDAHGLLPAPIPRAWILEGNPSARNKRLACSGDERASAFMWDCTAGRFSWPYPEEEIAHVLEGAVVIENPAGARQALQAGDTFVFPAGSTYQWTVPSYVRKISFVHAPLPRSMRLVQAVLEPLTAPFRAGPAAPKD